MPPRPLEEWAADYASHPLPLGLFPFWTHKNYLFPRHPSCFLCLSNHFPVNKSNLFEYSGEAHLSAVAHCKMPVNPKARNVLRRCCWESKGGSGINVPFVIQISWKMWKEKEKLNFGAVLVVEKVIQLRQSQSAIRVLHHCICHVLKAPRTAVRTAVLSEAQLFSEQDAET